jgi:chorismate synthase
MFSIGGIKGVQIGEGFELAKLRGSASNDSMDSDGFTSNRSGGVLGGISTGMPVILRLAIKASPSIGIPQKTADIHGVERVIEINGRHDLFLPPRIAPVAEAMAYITLADFILPVK